MVMRNFFFTVFIIQFNMALEMVILRVYIHIITNLLKVIGRAKIRKKSEGIKNITKKKP